MKPAIPFSRLCAAALLSFGLSHAVPVLTGSGAEPDAASGSFGSTGNIFEYRVQSSPGISYATTMTTLADALMITYSFTALSELDDVSTLLYLDADINQDANTWFNERGEALVATGGADTWEIDEPGFGNVYIGDIYDHYVAGAYDGTVFNGQPDMVEDVAMGLGLHFGNLGANDTLRLQVLLSESAIGNGWGTVLHQWDADDGLAGDNLYFGSRFSIGRYAPPPDTNPEPGPDAVPEPGTIALLFTGLALLGFRRRA